MNSIFICSLLFSHRAVFFVVVVCLFPVFCIPLEHFARALGHAHQRLVLLLS